MILYLQKDLINKMIYATKKGFLIGEKLFDIFYIDDVISSSFNKIKNSPLITNIIGEYIYYKKQPEINPHKLFSKKDIQWIKLIITNNTLTNTENIMNNISFKAFLKTLDKGQKDFIIEAINIIIV